jgi:hypothetical protein
VQVVKNLPTMLGVVDQRLKEFVVEIFDIAGSTIVEEIKYIIQNVRTFVDLVKQNVLKFYNVSNESFECIKGFFYVFTLLK